MVEQHHALGHHEGVVVGERHHPGSEPDVAGTLGGGGDEQLGRADDLVTGRVVLADPRLVEAELVQADEELEVTLQGERRVLARRLERGHEDAEAQRPVHRAPGVARGGPRQSSRSGCSRTIFW
ncbi:MAG TPA: hypothetical protein VK428_01485 [Acidimicrobiales bacterium]|nr:hypothetical protein [Acidimicrobiales bacterium]